jgi:hypothetical protein
VSGYYYAWIASQMAQETGLREILGGAMALSLAWILLPVAVPSKYLQLVRRVLSWVIMVMLLGTMLLLGVRK